MAVLSRGQTRGLVAPPRYAVGQPIAYAGRRLTIRGVDSVGRVRMHDPEDKSTVIAGEGEFVVVRSGKEKGTILGRWGEVDISRLPEGTAYTVPPGTGERHPDITEAELKTKYGKWMTPKTRAFIAAGGDITRQPALTRGQAYDPKYAAVADRPSVEHAVDVLIASKGNVQTTQRTLEREGVSRSTATGLARIARTALLAVKEPEYAELDGYRFARSSGALKEAGLVDPTGKPIDITSKAILTAKSTIEEKFGKPYGAPVEPYESRAYMAGIRTQRQGLLQEAGNVARERMVNILGYSGTTPEMIKKGTRDKEEGKKSLVQRIEGLTPSQLDDYEKTIAEEGYRRQQANILNELLIAKGEAPKGLMLSAVRITEGTTLPVKFTSEGVFYDLAKIAKDKGLSKRFGAEVYEGAKVLEQFRARETTETEHKAVLVREGKPSVVLAPFIGVGGLNLTEAVLAGFTSPKDYEGYDVTQADIDKVFTDYEAREVAKVTLKPYKVYGNNYKVVDALISDDPEAHSALQVLFDPKDIDKANKWIEDKWGAHGRFIGKSYVPGSKEVQEFFRGITPWKEEKGVTILSALTAIKAEAIEDLRKLPLPEKVAGVSFSAILGTVVPVAAVEPTPIGETIVIGLILGGAAALAIREALFKGQTPATQPEILQAVKSFKSDFRRDITPADVVMVSPTGETATMAEILSATAITDEVRKRFKLPPFKGAKVEPFREQITAINETLRQLAKIPPVKGELVEPPKLIHIPPKVAPPYGVEGYLPQYRRPVVIIPGIGAVPKELDFAERAVYGMRKAADYYLASSAVSQAQELARKTVVDVAEKAKAGDGVATETLVNNWYRRLGRITEIKESIKVAKSLEGIDKVMSTLEKQGRISADEAARWAAQWEQYQSARVARRIPLTPAQEALQKERTLEGMRIAAEIAAKARDRETAKALESISKEVSSLTAEGKITAEVGDAYRRAYQAYLSKKALLDATRKAFIESLNPKLIKGKITYDVMDAYLRHSLSRYFNIPEFDRALKNAIALATETYTKAITEGATATQAQARAKSAVQPAISEAVATATATTLATMTQTMTQTQAQTATQTLTQILTQTMTNTAVNTAVNVATITPAIPSAITPAIPAIITPALPITITPIEPIIPRLPIEPRLPIILSRLQTQSPISQPIPAGSIAWAQGERKGVRGLMVSQWFFIPPPYDMDKPISLSAPPLGAVRTDSASPYDTIQIIGRSRTRVPRKVDVDLGWADITILNGRKITFKSGGEDTDIGSRLSSPTVGMDVDDGDLILTTPVSKQGVNRAKMSKKKPKRKGKRLTSWEYMTTLKGFRPS